VTHLDIDELAAATSFGLFSGRTAIAAERLLHGEQPDDFELRALDRAGMFLSAVTSEPMGGARPLRSVSFLVTEGLEALESYRPLDENLFEDLKGLEQTVHRILEGRSADVQPEQLTELRDLFLTLSQWALTHANDLSEPASAGRSWITSNANSRS
jgi:hypothetical protein